MIPAASQSSQVSPPRMTSSDAASTRPMRSVVPKSANPSPRPYSLRRWRMPPLPWPPVLRLVLPKGSLERATLELFEAADLQVSRSSDVAYRATTDDPRTTDVRTLRPQQIPRYVTEA